MSRERVTGLAHYRRFDARVKKWIAAFKEVDTRFDMLEKDIDNRFNLVDHKV